MPIPTDVTIEESFSVIDGIDVAPPGAVFAAYVESGLTQLTSGQQVRVITFTTEKAALSYIFDELEIVNEVDATPLVLGFTLTNHTTTGFEVTLTGTPDTGNYYLRWKVRIPTTVVEGAVVATPSTGAVTEVTVSGSDGIFGTVSNPTTAPTINLSLLDGEIALSKLETQPVTGEVLTPTNAKTVTNKLIDGNNNTLQNISLGSLSGDGIIAQSVTDPGYDAIFRWNNTNNNVDLITPNQAFTAAASEVKVVTAQGVTNVYKATANTDLARGVALTSAFAAHANGDTIVVGIGTFEVAASLPLKHANLYGQGMNNTTIRAGDRGGGGTSGAIVSFAAYDSDQGVRHIKGILFDCNLQNQSAAAIQVGAVELQNTAVIEECGAVNWGGKSGATENFVFITGTGVGQGTNSTKFLNNRIFHCAQGITNMGVTTLFDTYSNLNGSTVDSDWTMGAEFAGNVVHDITVGTGAGQPGAIHFITIDQCYGCSIHDNFAFNMFGDSGAGSNRDNTMIYGDTFCQRSMSVYNNTFINVCQPIYVDVQDATRILDNWHITGNHFEVNSTGNGLGIVVGNIAASTHGWVISNNYIKAPAIGISVQVGSNWTFENNVIDAPTAIATNSATAITQHNNHKPDGTVVGTPTPWTVAEGGTGSDGSNLSASGTGGAGYLQLPEQSATPSTPTNASRIFIDASNRLSWVGENGWVRTFDGTGLSASRVYTLPNVTGTVVLGGANNSMAGSTVFASQDLKLSLSTNSASHRFTNAFAATNIFEAACDASFISQIAFFNATPVIKQAGTGETTGFTAGGGTTVTDSSTFTGNVGSTAYRISDIVKALKNYGLLAS